MRIKFLIFSFVFNFFFSVSLKVPVLSLDFSVCHMLDQHVCLRACDGVLLWPSSNWFISSHFFNKAFFFIVSSSYSFQFSLPCFRNLVLNLSFIVSFPIVDLAYPSFSARGITVDLFLVGLSLAVSTPYETRAYFIVKNGSKPVGLCPSWPFYCVLRYLRHWYYLDVVLVFLPLWHIYIYVLALPQRLHYARHRCLLRRRIIFLYHALWYIYIHIYLSSGPSPVSCTRTP